MTLWCIPHHEPFGELVLYKQDSPKRKQALDSIKSYPFKRKQNSLSITYSSSTLPYFTSYLLYFVWTKQRQGECFSPSFLGEYYDVFVLFSNNTARRSKEFGMKQGKWCQLRYYLVQEKGGKRVHKDMEVEDGSNQHKRHQDENGLNWKQLRFATGIWISLRVFRQEIIWLNTQKKSNFW